MYNASDIVEMGNAQELILSVGKEIELFDDGDPMTEYIEDSFDR